MSSAGNLGSLLIEVGAQTATLQSDMARAQRIVGTAVQDLNVKINSVGSSANFNGVSSSVKSLQGDFAALRNAAASVFAVDLGAQGIRQIMAVADAYQGVTNRIMTTVTGTQQLMSVQAQVFSIAQKTGQELDDTAKMYQRLEQSIQSSGKTQMEAQQQALALTKTLNQEIVVSGASAGEASRSIMDLVHGLSGGVLHAQQLRPIMRQMPDLAHQIAIGLGVSAQEFEKMVHGGLRAEDVLKALEKQSGAIDERFNALPKTFARVWQELHNAVEQYIGKQAQASAGAQILKGAISGLANNIATVGVAVEAAAGAMALWLGGKAVTSLAGMAAGVRDMVLAQGEYKTAAMLAAEAEVAVAVARQQSGAATLQRIVQENELRLAENAENATKIAALKSEEALLARRLESLPVGVNIISETLRLEAVRAELAVATLALAKAEDTLTTTFARQELAEHGAAASAIELAAANQAMAASQVEAGSAMGMLSRAGAGAFALIGGWPTVALAAAAATAYWITSTTDLTDAMSAMNAEARKQEAQALTLTEVLRGVTSGQAAHKSTLAELAQAKRADAVAEIESLKLKRDSIPLTLMTISLWEVYQGKIWYAEHALRKFDEAQGDLNLSGFNAKIAGAVEAMRRMFSMTGGGAGIELPDTSKLEEKVRKESEALEKQVATFGRGKVALIEYERAQAVATATVGLSGKALEDQTLKVFELYQHNIDLAMVEDSLTAAKKAGTAATKAHGVATREAKQESERYEQVQLKLTLAAVKLGGEVGGPLNKAYATYVETVIRLNAEAQKDIGNHAARIQVTRNLEAATAAAARALEYELQKEKERASIGAKHLESLKAEIAAIGQTSVQQKVAADVQRIVNELRRQGADFNGKYYTSTEDLTRALNEQLPAYAQQVLALEKQRDAMQKAAAHVKAYEDIVKNAFNSMIDKAAEWAVSGFKNAKEFWKGMVSTMKSAVAQMLAEWAKTKIIGFFGNRTGGGGYAGLFAAGAAAFSGSSASGSVSGSSGSSPQATGGYNYAQASGQGGGGGLMQYASMLGGGGGGGSWMAGVGGAYGPPTAAQQAVGTYGPWAGAAAGALYGSTRGGDGVGQAAGIALGAIAGYYAGTIAVGYLAAGIGTSAVAATATTAATAGTGAMGAVSAVPIVGWVAAIILAIDAVSGGKVLGTKYRPESSKTTIGFGPDGAQAHAGLTEWRYKRSFLRDDVLGGITHFGDKGRREKDLPIPPEFTAMINKLFDGFKKTYMKAAEALHTDVASFVEGSFETIITYTKKGKKKAEKTISEVLGKTYEETFEAFQSRMHAEGLIATLAKVADGVNAIAESYRANAAGLMDAAATMFQGQIDMTSGKGLLGLSSSLADLMARVENMRQGDEKLVETYARLAQASQQYRDIVTKMDDAMKALTAGTGPVDQMRTALEAINKQIVDNSAALNAAAVAAGLSGAAEKDLARVHDLAAAQMAKISRDFFGAIDSQISALTDVHTPSGDFAIAMRTIYKTMTDNIAQANMLAKAQGMQGASAQQAAKIIELASKQAAAALAQLVNIGKAQAHSLGYNGPQNMAELDAAIADLQGRLGSASSSFSDFGGAISSAAAAADNAINLLLGALSPLNDQQKLQTALGGLYSGTVSQEQVLEIGRRLFASTAAYTALFAQVMAAGGRAGKGNDNGASQYGSSGGASSGGLTGEESQRLKDLLVQRDEMVKQQRLAEARDLASTIASISATQGTTFADVAGQLGFDLSKLGKDLGLTNDQLMTYLQGIDVNGENVADTFTTGIDKLIRKLEQIFGATADPTQLGVGLSGRVRSGEVTDFVLELRKRASDDAKNTDKIVDSNKRVESRIMELTAAVREGVNTAPRGNRVGVAGVFV